MSAIPLETIPCALCGNLTDMTGIKRCYRCWELETRITRDEAIAWKILVAIQIDNAFSNEEISQRAIKAAQMVREEMTK